MMKIFQQLLFLKDWRTDMIAMFCSRKIPPSMRYNSFFDKYLAAQITKHINSFLAGNLTPTASTEPRSQIEAVIENIPGFVKVSNWTCEQYDRLADSTFRAGWSFAAPQRTFVGHLLSLRRSFKEGQQNLNPGRSTLCQMCLNCKQLARCLAKADGIALRGYNTRSNYLREDLFSSVDTSKDGLKFIFVASGGTCWINRVLNPRRGSSSDICRKESQKRYFEMVEET